MMPHRKRRGLFPVLFLLFLALTIAAVWWLWNHVLVAVVPVRPITYWQAAGLLALARLLFGGFKFGPGGRGFGPGGRWQNMSDEERAKLRAEWRKRFGKE